MEVAAIKLNISARVLIKCIKQALIFMLHACKRMTYECVIIIVVEQSLEERRRCFLLHRRGAGLLSEGLEE